MLADMEVNEKLSPIVTELFLRSRKLLNILFAFILQSHFEVPKIRLNATHCFIIKIPNKRELQQIGSNNLSDLIHLLEKGNKKWHYQLKQN